MKLLVITQKVDQNDQLLGFFIRWLELLAERFKKLTVICLERGEFILPNQMEVISLGKERSRGKFKILSAFYFLLLTLHRDYDAVFVHMNPVWVILGGWWWRLTGKKIFFWYTSGGVTSKLKWAEKWANVIFTASPESFRLPSKKLLVTGHGIDTEMFKPADYKPKTGKDKLKILSVGRITPVKNYETLVETAKILKNKGMDFLVTIIGEAPLKKDQNYELRVKNQIKEWSLEKYFNFVGKVSHQALPEYYQAHDLFVHLSKTGSLDKVLLEAMACELPVLSSSEAAKSVLPSALIFPEGEAVKLADKIEFLSQNVFSYGLRNRVLENHDLSKLIAKISEQIYV